MAIFRLILANLKKRKTYTIAIFILVFLAGFLITTSISTIQRSMAIYDAVFDSVSPHKIYYFNKSDYSTKYYDWFKSKSNVREVQAKEVCNVEEPVITVKGKVFEQINSITLETYNNTDKLDNPLPTGQNQYTPLKKGEVLVPIAFKKQLDLAEGESFILNAGGKKLSLKVSGFIKDPLSGSPTIHMKRLKISVDDYENIFTPLATADNKYVYQSTALSVRLSDKNSLDSINKEFTDNFSPKTHGDIDYESSRQMTILTQQLMLVILIVFSILLCILAMFVIRFSILSAIEADYTSLGVLKGLGFTPRNINLTISGQYAFIAVTAVVTGFFVGVLATPLLGKTVMEATALPWEGSAPVGTSLLSVSLLVIIIMLFTNITVRRTRKISPVKAIRQGMAEIHFSSALSINLSGINRLPFSLIMVIKQITSRMKNCILLFIISMILALSLTAITLVSNTISGGRMYNMFGLMSSDIWLLSNTSAGTADSLISDIKSRYATAYVTVQGSTRLTIGDLTIHTYVSRDYDKTDELPCYKGRNPKLYNEIAITPVISKKLNKNIGDYIRAKNDKGEEFTFIITGLYQSVNDLGSTLRVNESAVNRIDPGMEINDIYIKLMDDISLSRTVDDIRNYYGERVIKVTDYSKIIKDSFGSIQSSIVLISIILLIASMIIIIIVTLLMSRIASFKERKEMGIYKSLGFTGKQIRMQFAARFLTIVGFGVIIGSVIAVLFTGGAFSAVLSSIGIASFKVDSGYLQVLAEMVCIMMFAFLSAYQSSGIAKKVTAYNLINE